jgi:3-oxoacyl-[acyl-carrier protein] reductase
MKKERRMADRRTALVTGVGRRRGIGAEIALGLAEDGWDLALSFWTPYDERLGLPRSPDELDRLADDIRALGRTVVLLPADLERPDEAASLVDAAADRLGPLSGLVLSHCESVDSGFLDTSVESFDRHYAVNVRAPWLLIAALARQLPASGGRVVALTSDATVGNLPYGSTKGALDRLVVAAADELADRGLLANVINPGPVDTGWMNDEIRRAVLERQPTNRLGTPRDTANLVRFLFSEQGDWVNGQLLHSDGGFRRS